MMATVEVTIPRMLADLVDSERRLTVNAHTVDGALLELVEAHPELRVHVFDEHGAIRHHVSCFHNGAMVTDRSAAMTDGDDLVILQAVSGGEDG